MRTGQRTAQEIVDHFEAALGPFREIANELRAD